MSGFEKKYNKLHLSLVLKTLVTSLLIIEYIFKFDWIVIDVTNFKIYQVYEPDIYVILGMILGFIVRSLAIYFMWCKPKSQTIEVKEDE